LLVIFIVWSFWILIKISGAVEENEKNKNKNEEALVNVNTIFAIEIFIYSIHLADYTARIFMGGYIL
jgi:hypothetical protein